MQDGYNVPPFGVKWGTNYLYTSPWIDGMACYASRRPGTWGLLRRVRDDDYDPLIAAIAACERPITLAIDIGGTGLKAVTLDPKGKIADRSASCADAVSAATAHGSSQNSRALVRPGRTFDRVSVGFPGMVRNGRVLTSPHLVLSDGPDSKVDPDSLKAWTNFDLASALTKAFGKPTRVVNDADLQGLDAATGKGLEVVVTLGHRVRHGSAEPRSARCRTWSSRSIHCARARTTTSSSATSP